MTRAGLVFLGLVCIIHGLCPPNVEPSEIQTVCDFAQKIVNQVASNCIMDDKVDRIDCALLFTRQGLSESSKEVVKDPQAVRARRLISEVLMDWAEKGSTSGDFEDSVKKNLKPSCDSLEWPRGK